MIVFISTSSPSSSGGARNNTVRLRQSNNPGSRWICSSSIKHPASGMPEGVCIFPYLMGRPKRPHGLTTRTAAMTMKMNAMAMPGTHNNPKELDRPTAVKALLLESAKAFLLFSGHKLPHPHGGEFLYLLVWQWL